MSGSFESLRWNACVHRLDLGLYSHPKEFWGNGVRTHVNSKEKIPSTGKILLRGGSNPRRCIKQDSESNTLPTSYSGPILKSKTLNSRNQFPLSERKKEGKKEIKKKETKKKEREKHKRTERKKRKNKKNKKKLQKLLMATLRAMSYPDMSRTVNIIVKHL